MYHVPDYPKIKPEEIQIGDVIRYDAYQDESLDKINNHKHRALIVYDADWNENNENQIIQLYCIPLTHSKKDNEKTYTKYNYSVSKIINTITENKLQIASNDSRNEYLRMGDPVKIKIFDLKESKQNIQKITTLDNTSILKLSSYYFNLQNSIIHKNEKYNQIYNIGDYAKAENLRKTNQGISDKDIKRFLISDSCNIISENKNRFQPIQYKIKNKIEYPVIPANVYHKELIKRLPLIDTEKVDPILDINNKTNKNQNNIKKSL